MKRRFCALLAVLLAIAVPALAGCKKNNGPDPAQTTDNAVASSVNGTDFFSDPTVDEGGFAGFTKEQIVYFLTAAINKTKEYTGEITVHHKENGSTDIREVKPGGKLTARGLNFIKDMVHNAGDEDYRFADGVAYTSEGELTQLLLPRNETFSLSPEGVADARIAQEGELVHVAVKLVPEQVESLTAVPEYNAGAIGYLNLQNSFSVIKLTEIRIEYPASVIDAYVRADGYVARVTYTVPMDTYAQTAAIGLTGSATLHSEQTEIWELAW